MFVYYVEELFKEKLFDVVIFFNEIVLDMVCIIVKIFNVKGFFYNVNLIMCNKDMMCEMLVGKNFLIDLKVCNIIEDIDEFLNKKDSIIIKFLIGVGGKGVFKLDIGDDVGVFIKDNGI